MTQSAPASSRWVAGLDLGSTGVKILVTDEAGTQLLALQRPTPWQHGPGGTTELEPRALLDTLAGLLDEAASRLDDRPGCGRVEALAISGMGETGVLVDSQGSPRSAGIAWFDPRGAEQVAALPETLRGDFAGRTGLPLGVQVSAVKLLHLRDNGVPLTGCRWFNLPEYVALALGGTSAGELSLASRTGLLDQDSGQLWWELADHLGVGDDFLPPMVTSGTDTGAVAAAWAPPMFAGARLTVAGHDHLVSTVAGGGLDPDRYLVSMGTAEVLLRVLDEPIPYAARAHLAGYLINCVRHIVPGQYAVVAGVKTGLLMRRALQLAGISDRAGRDTLDAAACAIPLEGLLPRDAIEVRGARNDDGVLSLTVRGDGATPAELFNAVLRHGNDEIVRLVEVLDGVIPPARSTILTGGWAGMASVRRARSQVLPGLEVSTRGEDTAYGAARIAARLLTDQTAPPPARTPHTTL
ncbi:FGGY-family carbohydrate kinase [Nostocoides veronense]|uniref:FGGY family carbohydrate kinase n=1 Tax=Nostocoides veronense TaxID=330836 RepID=A0ABN2L9G8_9MICO